VIGLYRGCNEAQRRRNRPGIPDRHRLSRPVRGGGNRRLLLKIVFGVVAAGGIITWALGYCPINDALDRSTVRRGE